MSKNFWKKGYIQLILLIGVVITIAIGTIVVTVKATEPVSNKQITSSRLLAQAPSKPVLVPTLCVPPGECLTDRDSQTCCYGDPITDLSCG